MPKIALFKQDGSQAGDLELNETVFGIEPNNHVLHEAVVMHNANKRQGTHAVKSRSEVSGGGAKPWRQKGTGRARHGSNRSPIWVGGGVVFGPNPERNYSYKMPKKVRRLALRSALSTKVKEDNLVVLESLQFEKPKTKDMVQMLKDLNVDTKTLIITASNDEFTARSANNLQNVNVMTFREMNVHEMLKHDKLILTKEAADKAGEVLG